MAQLTASGAAAVSAMILLMFQLFQAPTTTTVGNERTEESDNSIKLPSNSIGISIDQQGAFEIVE